MWRANLEAIAEIHGGIMILEQWQWRQVDRF